MSFDYTLHPSINLYVKGRIVENDASRQEKTVSAILDRLKGQPGLILADEVGMGKTFVALAVAVSVYLKEKRTTVIMIPPNLVDKWPNDFRLFTQACITDENVRKKLRCGIARRPEEFLKYLDDDASQRCAIIFLTYGALTRNMGDGWIKLAIIKKALFRRRNIDDLYKSLNRHAGALIEKQYISRKDPEIWEKLLKSPVETWLSKLKDLEILGDDPVPKIFAEELEKLPSAELETLFHELWNHLPRRDGAKVHEHLNNLRGILRKETRLVWANCLAKIKLKLPLLVFDEAHHLKNSQTRLVTTLFQEPEAEEEAGILARQFDRMLFLTATPFQLGHHELLNVLQRFGSINWSGRHAPTISAQEYKQELDQLLSLLNHSQIAARKLDNAWGKLKTTDLLFEGKVYEDIYEWWSIISSADASTLSPSVQKVLESFSSAKEKLKIVEPVLKKYVIRHLKPREMGVPFKGVKRRKHLPGSCISEESLEKGSIIPGLAVNQESVLPFLLAARLSSIRPDQRPVFAEGLASSFEAFRYTRDERLKKQKNNLTDLDDEELIVEKEKDPVATWYLEELDHSLLAVSSGSMHPKIKPSVDKAIELWSKGEKVLIFCHYIATGKALRNYISREMKAHIRLQGALILNCLEGEVFDELDKLANRIASTDSPLHKKCLLIINKLLDEFDELSPLRQDIIDAIIRYMKTPSFLVRFAVVSDQTNDEWLDRSFNSKDHSGISLIDLLRSFLKFLVNRNEDRAGYVSALKSIQPGGIRTNDVTAAFENDELPDDADNTIMANVRLCYGATLPETRRKLMKTFNTPFFPDILITSSVMAEGVDLHLNCRHIIHHDLSWNPSTLEQRTGRVDRIGAKAEICGQPIHVYMPYLSETQDEKMYRVVTERERWFNIIMGEKYKVDAFSTDKYAERIPLPEELASELAFRLEV